MSMVQSPEWIWKIVTLFFTSFSHLKDSGLLENFHTNVVVEGEVAAGGGPPAVPPLQHCSYQGHSVLRLAKMCTVQPLHGSIPSRRFGAFSLRQYHRSSRC